MRFNSEVGMMSKGLKMSRTEVLMLPDTPDPLDSGPAAE